MGSIFYEEKNAIGFLTIDRPKALNAMDLAVVAELGEAAARIAACSARCLVITGAGDRAFVAGADVAEMAAMSPEEGARLCESGNAVMRAIETLPMPTIAAVNGFALGGGFELALACDIRIASENAVFALPEVTLGIIPGYGGMQRLARTIGIGQARELVFTGGRVKAAEALALGLVNSVHTAGDLMAAATALAVNMAANAPLAVRAAKQVLNNSLGSSLAEAYLSERELFSRCFGTRDQREAMAAFVEKRKPAPFVGE